MHWCISADRMGDTVMEMTPDVKTPSDGVFNWDLDEIARLHRLANLQPIKSYRKPYETKRDILTRKTC